MKKIIFFFALLIPLLLAAQSKKVDPLAILILDGTSDVIGDLESCSFDTKSSKDYNDPDAGLIKVFKNSTVVFDGANKLLVRLNGEKGDRGIWYNEGNFTFYSFTENNYVSLEAPETTLEAIDKMHLNYGIEFPAADFFYPSFTDDIIADFDTIKFLGRKIIDNTECFHIKASNEKMDIQFWIANDIYRLPKKYLIIYKDDNNKQFEATFSNWELNKKFPKSIFQFIPPKGAKKIEILAKNK